MQNLLGKSLEELENIAEAYNQPKFRAKQIYQWLYDKKVPSIDDFKNLPKNFRENLKESYEISLPKILEVLEDPKDHTLKFLLEFSDHSTVESVLMHYPHGYSACLSTQVGCAMGCHFCASGKNGKARDLSYLEIAAQLIVMEDYSGKKISNIVLMGMGEPLDNYKQVIKFLKFAHNFLGFSYRSITISTCGLVPEIYKLAKEDLPINLAISLHSPFQKNREKVMPVAKKYSVRDLIKAAKDYFKQTGRRVTYEYTVIDGVNNSPADAKELAKLLKDLPHHINLIGLNSVTKRKQNYNKIVNSFAQELKRQGLNFTIRKKNGENIQAACGQLRNREIL